MMAISTCRWRAAVAAGLLSVFAPLVHAEAQVVPVPPGGPGEGVCSSPSNEGQGSPGSITNVVCNGSGLVFVAPAVGQVATVIGPVVIGPANIGSSNVSGGNAVTVP